MVQVSRVQTDLAAVVRTAVEDRRSTVEQSGMALILEVPDEPVWIAGDATRLTQVLNNLMDNAVKFRNGGDRVAVRLTVEESMGQAVINVRDLESAVEFWTELLGVDVGQEVPGFFVWLRPQTKGGVGIALRGRQVFVAGSYSSTVPSDQCRPGRGTAVSLGPGVEPPMT